MAGYINWCDFYSVGDKSIDDQHRQIIEIIDDLWKVMEKENNQTEVKIFLDCMVEYSLNHFNHEEEKMRECGYPDFSEHKALHDKMRQKVLDMREHLSDVSAHDLLQFMKQWWLDHIQGRDKKYAPYLERSQVTAINPS